SEPAARSPAHELHARDPRQYPGRSVLSLPGSADRDMTAELLDFWRRFRRNRAAVIGLVLLSLVLVLAVSAPVIYPLDPWSVVAMFKPSVATIVGAIATVSWPAVARLVRGQFIALRNREFVQASIAMGMGDGRIIFRQILPNTLAPIIVVSSVMIATAILTEA